MQQNVINLPTAKTITYRQNAPFREIGGMLKLHKNKINLNRLLIYLLIISNFVSWMFICGCMNSISTHTHDVSEYVSTADYSVPNLPPIEEVK